MELNGRRFTLWTACMPFWGPVTSFTSTEQQEQVPDCLPRSRLSPRRCKHQQGVSLEEQSITSFQTDLFFHLHWEREAVSPRRNGEFSVPIHHSVTTTHTISKLAAAISIASFSRSTGMASRTGAPSALSLSFLKKKQHLEPEAVTAQKSFQAAWGKSWFFTA